MAIQKPTVLFVHGSWHTPAHLARARDVFEESGFPTSCPLQPSIGSLPPIGLMEDAQCIKDELKRLVEKEGKDVIVVGHSYGGIVTTQAVDESFARSKRQKEGKDGGVLHLVYLCAFFLPIGSSLMDAFGGSWPPFIPIDEQGVCRMNDPDKRFYQDLPPVEQEHWVSELKGSPAVTQMTPLTYAAYLHYPVTYLYCTNDAAIPYEIQQKMVQNVSFKTGITVSTEQCDASHSPFLSMPQRVLELVQNVAT